MNQLLVVIFSDHGKMRALFLDLDDTIYSERMFKMSGFKAVASWLEANSILEFKIALSSMTDIITKKGTLFSKVFDTLCKQHSINSKVIPLLVEVFSLHKPNLRLYHDFYDFMENYNLTNFEMGLITDGIRSVQRRKIESLKLDKFVKPSRMIITNDLLPPMDKNNPEVFFRASRMVGLSGKDCVYIGDNPYKDFKHPKEQGWYTIRIRRGYFSDENSNEYVSDEIFNFCELSKLLDSWSE